MLRLASILDSVLVSPMPIPAQILEVIKPMIFQLKILFTTLNPHWILESQVKRYVGTKRRNWTSSVKIISIKNMDDKLIGYRKTIRHGLYSREWQKEIK